MKNKKINIHLLVASALVILYLVLISVQPIKAYPFARFDDELMVEQAESILKGQYLGKYNPRTLVKGIFTPMFIAVIAKLNIPFILAQNILYIFSIGMFINVIKKKIDNKNVLLILFAFLLFNPIMFSTELCRLYRDGIYVSLLMFLISSVLGIFLNRKEKIKKLIIYYITLGLSFSFIYICREETIWIMPFLGISTLVTILFVIFEKKCFEKIKKLCLYLLPIMIFLITILSVCTLNYKHYGVFQLNQYWSREFKEAYGAMTRIIPEEEIDKVPVTKDTIKQIATISPTFKQIEKVLSQSALGWSLSGDGKLSEIQGGWYHWALMEAMERNGYFENATKANEFYEKVAQEINEACDSGQIQNCLSQKRVSNTCRFDIEDILKALKKSPNTIKYQYSLQDVQIEVKNGNNRISKYTKEKLEFIEEISNTETKQDNMYGNKFGEIRLKTLEIIKIIYTFINKYIFYISIAMYLFVLYRFIREPKRLFEEILIITGIAVLYYCRIFVLTFTSEMMWTSAINTMYMATSYVLQFAFSGLAIIYGSKEIKKIIKKWREKWERKQK